MMEVLLIDEVSWRMNTQACVNVHTHKRKENIKIQRCSRSVGNARAYVAIS